MEPLYPSKATVAGPLQEKLLYADTVSVLQAEQ